MPLKAEIIKSCIEYAPDDKNFLNRDVESDFDSITYSSSIGCFTQIMTLSDTANKIFMNLSKEMKLSHERLQNLSHRVDIVGQRINDITNTEGYPSTLDANSRYGKDTYARTISLPGLLLETSEVPAQVAKVYDTLKPILPLKDLYSGITVHPRYQNPARRYTYPGYSTQAWLESHKAALKDEIRMREVAVADRTMRRQKFQGERQKFLQRVRKIEDKYAMSPSFSPGKRLRLDAWRDGIQKANRSEKLTDYSDFTDTDAPVRARGNSYAELMRRQAKLDLTDPSVLSNLDQDDADEYLETYAGVEGSTDDDKNFAGKGSYSPQRSKLSAIPSDHYIVAGDGSDDDDGDIEVVDADDDVEGELADKTRSIEAAEDSDDDDCDVVEEEVDEPAAESLPAPIDDGDDDDDCEVVEATDEITELTTELSGASLQETPPPVEPVEVLEEVKENEKESPNAVTTYRLQCSGQKVPVRSAPHPHAEVLRYLYSGTRIRAHALTIAGFFQLANGGGFVNRFTKKVDWIEESS